MVTMRSRLGLGLVVGVFVLLDLFLIRQPTAASAHAQAQGSTPAAGARLASPPRQLTVRFSEAPSVDSRITVADGCGHAVDGLAVVRQHSLVVPLDAGQPGRWAVHWDVISADDGHATSAGYGFTVSGTADCTTPAVRQATEVGSPGRGGLPVLALLLAGTAVVGGALVVRNRLRWS
jgi:copper transport protein